MENFRRAAKGWVDVRQNVIQRRTRNVDIRLVPVPSKKSAFVNVVEFAKPRRSRCQGDVFPFHLPVFPVLFLDFIPYQRSEGDSCTRRDNLKGIYRSRLGGKREISDGTG